jgi:hypothetical protein
MGPAENSERRKSAEEEQIAGPSVHQHVRETEQAKRDEGRVTGELEHAVSAAGAAVGGCDDRTSGLD